VEFTETWNDISTPQTFIATRPPEKTSTGHHAGAHDAGVPNTDPRYCPYRKNRPCLNLSDMPSTASNIPPKPKKIA